MGSVFGGGNFWAGAGQGLIVTGLNHLGEEWFRGKSVSYSKEVSHVPGGHLSEPDLGIDMEITATAGGLIEEPNSVFYTGVNAYTDIHKDVSTTYTFGTKYNRVGLTFGEDVSLHLYGSSSAFGHEIYFSTGFDIGLNYHVNAGRNVGSGLTGGYNVHIKISPLVPLGIFLFKQSVSPAFMNGIQRATPALQPIY